MNNLSSCYTKSKNDSYSTQWHTKGFQNIGLVSQYSKSVSCKNSKCLDFVLVQVTRIVKKWHNLSFMLHKIKNDSYSTQWHIKGFQNIKFVSHYSKSVSCKNSKCLDFVLVQVTRIVKKWHNLSFMLHKIKKWLPFNTMAYQGLPKYQISFPLFRVSGPYKSQMSWFCVGTSNTYS